MRRLSASINPEEPKRRSARPFALIVGSITQVYGSAPLYAQQRNPAFEVYGLTGGYYLGNTSNVLKDGEWNPQFAGDILIPFRPRWAVMIDGATSHLEVNQGPHSPYPYDGHPFSEFYRQNPGLQNNDVTTQRLIAILPSVVRPWIGDRFSSYAGVGLGLERQSQFIRYQPAHPRKT